MVGFLLVVFANSCHAWTIPNSINPSSFQLLMSTTTTPSSMSTDLPRPQQRRITLKSGREATLLSRSLDITKDWAITVWEWENPAEVIESYWEAQRQNDVLIRDSRLLDPFGLVTWPGSVVAAQELRQHSVEVVENSSVLILGAGVGVEAQAAAMLGASNILATDIHPTTLQQLELGVRENTKIPNKEVVTTQILDVFKDEDEQHLPKTDLLIVADVLYNEKLATQVCTRIVQACRQNRDIKVLVTDSQRFVDFPTELNARFQSAGLSTDAVEWKEETFQFTGSGVCIDEDQTYDVKVRTLWIGLKK
jgi:predicted nicotinamide N-methyase